MELDRNQKQEIINKVTDDLKNRQWFNGCGFEGNTLVVAYNFYPAFELVMFKNLMSKYGIVEHDLRDIRNIIPGTHKDDVPSYIKM